MPRKKVFMIQTITRGTTTDTITAVDLKGGLSAEEAGKILAAPSDAERRLIEGEEVSWRPSVTIGEPRKRKAKADEKPATKPKKPAPAGTAFDTTGAKAPQQGENHGA
jgi:hypothetical protein